MLVVDNKPNHNHEPDHKKQTERADNLIAGETHGDYGELWDYVKFLVFKIGSLVCCNTMLAVRLGKVLCAVGPLHP